MKAERKAVLRARQSLQRSSAAFRQSLSGRFFVRLHMSLILAAVSVSGVVSSKVLLVLGLTSLRTRYLVAVLLSYGCFFLLVRLWLWYISPSKPSERPVQSSSGIDLNPLDFVDSGPDLDSALNILPGGGSGVSPSHGPFGGGGDFGGGGATDFWGDPPADNIRSAAVASRKSGSRSIGSLGSSKGGGLSLDIGDEGIVLVFFGLLVLVILGAGIYLVWEAPIILSEAAFQAVLATSLARASKRIDQPGWIGSVFKATPVPFAIVIGMTLIFGLVAHHYCPDATKIADIVNGCPSKP
jgi:hypothetical protein